MELRFAFYLNNSPVRKHCPGHAVGQTTLCLPQLGPYAARDAIHLPPDNECSPCTSSTPTDNSIPSKSQEQPVKGQLKIAVVELRKPEEKGHFSNIPFLQLLQMKL